MPTVAVLPVKSFRLGKGRMAEDVFPDVRLRLGQALAERTADVAVDAGLIPLLVAGDPEVADWALHRGFPTIPDPNGGLNGAAGAGAQWASLSGSAWIVLHTDLPLLVRAEVEDLTRALAGGTGVIAPSADGGTSALGGSGDAEFAYGPGSFHHHLARFPEARVLSRLGLLHDVDSFSDLESARAHPRGGWLRKIVP